MESDNSAFHDFRDRINKLEKEVNSMKSRSFSSSADSTSDSDGEIPIEPLMTMKGTLNEIKATILKDDGCTTNVISQDFVTRNLGKIQVEPSTFEIYHSKKEVYEPAFGKVLQATVKIGQYSYTSNWVVASCNYDIILGMPWHRSCNPKVDYQNRELIVNKFKLPVEYPGKPK